METLASALHLLQQRRRSYKKKTQNFGHELPGAMIFFDLQYLVFPLIMYGNSYH